MEQAIEQAAPSVLQFGAMGILAAGFIVLLVLFVRADKRSQDYAGRLAEERFDRGQLIGIVQANTTANNMLSSQLARMCETQTTMATVVSELGTLIKQGVCPFDRRPREA